MTLADLQSSYAFYWGGSEFSAQQARPVDASARRTMLTLRGQIQEAIGIADKLGLIRPIVEQPQYHMLHRDRFEVEYRKIFDAYGYGAVSLRPHLIDPG